MEDDKQRSPTGRAEVNGSIPRQCPLCELGHKATEKQAVVETDFSGVELRVLSWAQKDVDGLTTEIVEALKEADPSAPATVVLDSYPFYAPKSGDVFRMLDTPTTAGRFGEHHLTLIRDGHLRALAAQQLGFNPLPKPEVKRKNAPKGKRGRAQWWNR